VAIQHVICQPQNSIYHSRIAKLASCFEENFAANNDALPFGSNNIIVDLRGSN